MPFQAAGPLYFGVVRASLTGGGVGREKIRHLLICSSVIKKIEKKEKNAVGVWRREDRAMSTQDAGPVPARGVALAV